MMMFVWDNDKPTKKNQNKLCNSIQSQQNIEWWNWKRKLVRKINKYSMLKNEIKNNNN
jgi:hypothetical protein